MRNFTKIIATIGPASDSVATIRKLHNGGMSVARLNFSHGSHDYFKKVISNIRKVSSDIAIMLDTKGPEIRTGNKEKINLAEGQEIELVPFNAKAVDDLALPISYKKLADFPKGTIIILADGLIELEVVQQRKSSLLVRVKNGDTLTPNAKVAVRDYTPDLPFFSKKDRDDLLFGIKNNLDFVAASFVMNAMNVFELRDFARKHNSDIKIISKIEHPEAVKNIHEIVKESDGVMVARGDLGISLSLEKVPKIQAEIIQLCNMQGKPVIVATQMLESMKENIQPTRAEVNDVAQAVLQGADAVMLSAETATGKYPVKVVHTMALITREYDPLVKSNFEIHHDFSNSPENLKVGLFVTHSAYLACASRLINTIIAPTDSGFTARNMSRFRPKCPIVAFTSNPKVLRQLQLSWGVFPRLEKKRFKTSYSMDRRLVAICFEEGFVTDEDKVVVVRSNRSIGIPYTNLIEVLPVSSVLGKVKKSILRE